MILLKSEFPLQVPVEARRRITHYRNFFGYRKTEWVCEQFLLETNKVLRRKDRQFEDAIVTHVVGYSQELWNDAEHFLIIVRTSQMIKTLPDIEGVSVLPTFFFCSQRIF